MGPFFRCDFIRILQSIRSFGFRGGIPKEKQVFLVPYFGPYGIWEVVLFSDVNLWSMNLQRSLGAWQSNWEGCNQKSEMLLPKWNPLKWLDRQGWHIFWSRVDMNDESLIFRLLTHIKNKRKVCRPDILQLHQLFCAKQIPYESSSLGLSSYSSILVLQFISSNMLPKKGTCFAHMIPKLQHHSLTLAEKKNAWLPFPNKLRWPISA